MGKLEGVEQCLQRVSSLDTNPPPVPSSSLISPQAYEDYLDDVLSLDLAAEAVSEKSLHSTSMLDFLVKEEPLGEEDLKALQKDRQKKDNHNMSKNISLSSLDFCLQQDSNNVIL